MSNPYAMSSDLDRFTDEKNPLQSLKSTIAFSSNDWVINKCDAWIYGIVLGWSDYDDPDAPEESAMEELKEKFGWGVDDVSRLKFLHAEYERLCQLKA